MAVPDLQDALDHLQDDDIDAAIESLHQKIEELPAHLTAHLLLGRAYEAKKQWEEALTCWENVYFLMPNSPVGRTGKARVLQQLEEGSDVPPDGMVEPEETAPEPPAQSSHAERTPTVDQDDASDEADEEIDDGPSDLEELRRQTEIEARREVARSSLTEAFSSTNGPQETPSERVGRLEEEEDDLERLINELESARVEPRPEVEETPPPESDTGVDDLVSETLARIHEAQDEFRQAEQIYVKLASQEPDQARSFLEKAAEMRRKAEAEAQPQREP